MDFEDVIRNRYSTTKFDGRPVEREKVERILEAGRLAPTAANKQPQRVYVLESRHSLVLMDQVTPCRYGASTALLVCSDTKEALSLKGTSFAETDACIAATHMMLEATNIGVDNIWLAIGDREQARRVFALPNEILPICFIDLGYAAPEDRPRAWHSERKPLSDTVRYI